MYNKKVLSEATANLDKAKAPTRKQDIITDPMGQWKYPGQNTRIPGGDITMQGVPYPVWAQPNIGPGVLMQPDQDYQFPEADYVDEFPMAKRGGALPKLPKKKNAKAYSRSLTATNKLFAQNPLTKKSKSKKNKIFNPLSKYFQDGGITKLTSKEEAQFQNFYNTLPDNLMEDDPTYDIRGYWDSEGRPEVFDYNQPKEDDGYYHAYSINSNTGEYLKAPTHPTFQHAVDEDRKIGYRPIPNVYGRNIAVENPSIANPEEQSFLRNMEGPANYIEADLTSEEIDEYRKGGYIVEELPQAQDGTNINTRTEIKEPSIKQCPEGYIFDFFKMDCVKNKNTIIVNSEEDYNKYLKAKKIAMQRNALYNKLFNPDDAKYYGSAVGEDIKDLIVTQSDDWSTSIPYSQIKESDKKLGLVPSGEWTHNSDYLGALKYKLTDPVLHYEIDKLTPLPLPTNTPMDIIPTEYESNVRPAKLAYRSQTSYGA
jgi:hypothetical protein